METSLRVVLNSYSYATHSGISLKGPSIKYLTLFWTNFDSLPLSHISGPPKVCHTSRTPQFLVVHACIHVFTGCLCKFAGFFVQGLSGGFCLERFVRGGFCPSPLLSEYIHYNRKLNITFNFSFHMYEFF